MQYICLLLIFCLGCLTCIAADNVYRSKRQEETAIKPGTISKKKCHDSYSKPDGFLTTPWGEIRADLRHMAAIGFGNKDKIEWLCSGSLISERFVLTVAHCKSFPSLGDAKWVRLGAKDLLRGKYQAVVQNFSILSFIPHPEYKTGVKYNNIALIELGGKVNITDNISPACLQTEKQLDENGLSMAHWEQVAPGEWPLLKINMNYVSNEDCNKFYNKTRRSDLEKGIDDEILICALSGYIDHFCQGISGGPLQVFDERQNVYSIVGVLSFTRYCLVTSPMVATRVSHYIPWIESVVWPNEKQ